MKSYCIICSSINIECSASKREARHHGACRPFETQIVNTTCYKSGGGTSTAAAAAAATAYRIWQRCRCQTSQPAGLVQWSLLRCRSAWVWTQPCRRYTFTTTISCAKRRLSVSSSSAGLQTACFTPPCPPAAPPPPLGCRPPLHTAAACREHPGSSPGRPEAAPPPGTAPSGGAGG